MISFLNKKSFLNTNQFNVFIKKNQPYKSYGNNNLIFGDNKRSKHFLNFKFSLFLRFKIYAFNYTKIEKPLMYKYDKNEFLNNLLSTNKSLYFQKNNIITFINNKIYENFNYNSVIMINNTLFFNNKEYFKAIYSIKYYKNKTPKKKVYNINQREVYLFLHSKIYRGNNIENYKFRNNEIYKMISYIYRNAFWNYTFFQEIEEGDFSEYNKFILDLKSFNERLMTDDEKISDFGLIYNSIYKVLLSNEFLIFLPTTLILQYGNEKPADIFESIMTFCIENSDDNKILNLKILEVNRQVITEDFFEKYCFEILKEGRTNILDKNFLKLFLKINLNQKLILTSNNFIEMRNIFIDIVLIETQNMFLNVDLQHFVNCYASETFGHSIKQMLNIMFKYDFTADWFDYRAPHIELITKIYNCFVTHPDILKHIGSEEFLFFLRFALTLIESKSFIKQVIICLNTETYGYFESKNLKIQKKIVGLNPLKKKKYMNYFGHEYSKKFISIDNIK